MGVDIRWFNHDLREYVDPGCRWGFTGHPVSCLAYTLLRGRWNGHRIALHSDHDGGEEFFDLGRQYMNVTARAYTELNRVGCWCVPGKTPDDPPEDGEGAGMSDAKKHRCMRCGVEFECLSPECGASYDVLPTAPGHECVLPIRRRVVDHAIAALENMFTSDPEREATRRRVVAELREAIGDLTT